MDDSLYRLRFYNFNNSFISSLAFALASQLDSVEFSSSLVYGEYYVIARAHKKILDNLCRQCDRMSERTNVHFPFIHRSQTEYTYNDEMEYCL